MLDLSPIISWKTVILDGLDWYDEEWKNYQQLSHLKEPIDLRKSFNQKTFTFEAYHDILKFIEMMKTLAFYVIDNKELFQQDGVERLMKCYRFIQLMLSYHFVDVPYHKKTLDICERIVTIAKEMKKARASNKY